MQIHKELLSGSTASGALSLKTAKFFGHMLYFLLVNPTTASTVWDVTITDDETGNVVVEQLQVEGVLRKEMRQPLRGRYTIAIANATADEAFEVELHLKEN